MLKRSIVGLLVLTALAFAQRRVDSKNTYCRVIAVVPFTGKGTPADPKRPLHAPWPPSKDPNGIIAFSYVPSDDGRFALVEFVARDRSALQAVLSDKSITSVEKGLMSSAAIESLLRQYRKSFSLDTFGMVTP